MDVRLPDGTIVTNVPEGTTKAQLMQKLGMSQPRIPDALDNPNMATEGMSGFNKFAAGVGKAGVDIGRGVGQLLGINSQADIDAAKAIDRPLMQTGAGFAGNVVGNVAATLPTIAIPGANTMVGAGLIGAGLGGVQPVGSEDSRIGNMVLGAAGGAGGQAAANAIGRVVRPVQSQLNEPVASLARAAEQKYNIPLNAAQKTGSRPLQIIESVLENMPLTADRQLMAKALQRNAFNKATLSTIGETAEQATPEVLNAARTRIGQSFNDLSARNTVTLGDDFLNALGTVEGRLNEFSSPAIKENIEKALNLAANGTLDGKTYQSVRSTLGRKADGAFRSGDSDLGQALKTIKSALDDAATASISAADREAWKQARNQWQNLKVVEKAAAPNTADAVAGNVSPAKLAQALLQVDRKGMTYGTRGDDLSELARIGQALIKDQIPNSGTAQRAFYQRFLENPLSAAWQSGVGGISLPAQMAINSKTGQAYLGAGPVSPRMLALAKALKQGAGMSGAALALTNSE